MARNPIIDLLGKGAPSPAGPPAEATGQPALIKETDTKNFAADVIKASMRAPVLVDFWAPWCGPCRQLTPVLEKLVRAAKGAVTLVKVNIDQNQALAGQLGIQSIPAVFAFSGGRPVDGFMGALPESQVREFIQRLTAKSGPEAQVEPLLKSAAAALEAGEGQQAQRVFSDVLRLDADNLAAIAGLARAQLLLGAVEEAAQTLERAPEGSENDAAIAGARAAVELARQPGAAGDIARLSGLVDADAQNRQARFDLAVALNAADRREEALDHLLAIIAGERDWNDKAAHRQLLTFFQAWGFDDPLSVRGRRRLSSLLFS